MDFFTDPCNVVTFMSLILALIVDANVSTAIMTCNRSEETADEDNAMTLFIPEAPVMDTLAMVSRTLHTYRVCSGAYPCIEEISYWVKPRSTTWFSRFLLEEYDNTRWVSMFRMTKNSVFSLAELLKPAVEKKKTKYRLLIPVLIRVACTLFKLTHGANLTVCSEMFAVERSTVCKMMREVVHAINDSLKHEVSWPSAQKIRESQTKFAEMCSLPAVIGAIDGVQISISKLDYYPADYYYFKSGGYSMNCQAVVDADKRFIDLYIGMPGSTNDSRMLRRSTLHYRASQGNLITADFLVDGHSPYLLGDLGYPLLPWLMVRHRGGRQLSVADMLFNRKLRGARCVVENAFGILKHTFRELLVKTDLHLAFLPDVILCCAILHNILLGQSPDEVANLLTVLRNEGMDQNDEVDGVLNAAVPPLHVDENVPAAARQEKACLGLIFDHSSAGSSLTMKEVLPPTTATGMQFAVFHGCKRSSEQHLYIAS